MFCLNSLLLTKKKIVTTPVTKASDSPSHGLIKYITLNLINLVNILPVKVLFYFCSFNRSSLAASRSLSSNAK